MKAPFKITGLFLTVLGILFFGSVSAENFFSESATRYVIEDEEVESGDLIVNKDNKLMRADQRYDNDLFGVVANDSIIIYGEEEEGSFPVVRSGPALVKVSNSYEEVEKGDYITSSENKGVGQKAPNSGFVIGKAMETLEDEEGKIKVMVNPQEVVIDNQEEWSEITLWEAVGRIFTAIERDVPEVLRYVLAMILVIGSLTLGFKSFVSALREGVAGISRNPLAKNSIRFSMILNLIGITILTLAGFVIALFVILL